MRLCNSQLLSQLVLRCQFSVSEPEEFSLSYLVLFLLYMNYGLNMILSIAGPPQEWPFSLMNTS